MSTALCASVARRPRMFDTVTPGRRPTTQCSAGLPTTAWKRLATFLTSPEVAPPGASPPVGEPYVAMAVSQEFSAEAAGIFRVIQPLADPIQAATTETVTDDATDPPPLTLRRPTPSEPETLTIAASSR